MRGDRHRLQQQERRLVGRPLRVRHWARRLRDQLDVRTRLPQRLDAVRAARDAGLTVDITVPVYELPTITGYVPGNEQIYPGWVTPEDHPAIRAALDAA